MNELTIVHANSLVEAAYSLSLDEMRLIALAATKVDSRKSKIGKIDIDASEYIEIYNIKSHNVYVALKDAIKSIMRKPIKVPIGNNKTKEIAWLSSNEYNNSNHGSSVSMVFSPEVEPYLFELKDRFTAINFEYAARLNTHFSFRLYQWLYKAKNFDKHKQGQSVEVTLDIEWMKKQACLNDSYVRWDNFKQYVINPAIDKINAETDISVIWQPIKKGRCVTAIKFNYILEKSTTQKPIRPRLLKKPKVKIGSHEYGEWATANYNLLSKYRTELKTYDKTLSLTLPDLRKMHEYALVIGYKDIANMLKKEIDERTPAPKAKKVEIQARDAEDYEKLKQFIKEDGTLDLDKINAIIQQQVDKIPQEQRIDIRVKK